MLERVIIPPPLLLLCVLIPGLSFCSRVIVFCYLDVAFVIEVQLSLFLWTISPLSTQTKKLSQSIAQNHEGKSLGTFAAGSSLRHQPNILQVHHLLPSAAPPVHAEIATNQHFAGIF